MSTPTGTSTYAHLLTRPGAAAFFAAAGVGRVGIAMTALGLLWLVRDGTGSYATAGTVTAGFALTEAVVGPQVARAVDRFGQTRALLVLAPAHLVAVVVLTRMVGSVPTALLVAAGALVGATIPQLGALSSARWVWLVGPRRQDLLPPAFSLESVANAVAYLLGPVVVSALAQRGSPVVGTVLAAALVSGGSLVLALLRGSAPGVLPRAPFVQRSTGQRGSTGERGSTGQRGSTGRLSGSGFVVVLLVNLAVGGYFGASQVAVTAFAVQHGASAALLFGISSTAGLLAGWAYGLRRWRSGPRRQLLCLGFALTLACGWLVAARSAPAAVVGLLVAGAVVPPLLVLSSVLVERNVARAVLTQAFTWVNSASAAGSAAAASVAGVVVDGRGAPAGFVVALGAAFAVTALSRGVSPRRARHPGGAGADR